MKKSRRVFQKMLAGLLAVLIAFTLVYVGEPKVKVEAAGTKLIAFTFDDGPSSAQTGRLLDGLSARGAKATFFMNGVNGAHGVRNNMSLVRRMVRDGHQIANHTWSHVTPFTKLSGGQMQSQVADVNSYLYDAMGGYFQTFVRIPGGARSSTISNNVNAPMILWSVDPLDWKYRNSNTVYNNIMNAASDGGIVLVHDLYGSSVDGALRAISSLQAQGYECVTVAELFRRRGVTPSNGSTYSKVGVTGTNLPAYSAPELEISRDNYANVTISLDKKSGLTYYYTTDGSTPAYKGNEFNGSITPDKNMTIKVVGYDKYGTRTPVASYDVTAGGFYGTFDAKFYADKYPDLKKAFGYDTDALWNHYIKYGMKEGRQGSAVFSLSYYKSKYTDLRNAFGDNDNLYLIHFAQFGINEKRQASENFDAKYYSQRYDDLSRKYGSDSKAYYTHYMQFGYNEKRAGAANLNNPVTTYNGVDYSKVFNYKYYISKYPDVKRVCGNNDYAALKQFVQYGMKEGRQGSPNFELQSYKNANSDLRRKFGKDNVKYYMHYINFGAKEGRKAVGVTKIINPTTVYEGKDYSSEYNFDYYISHYADIKRNYANDDAGALRHYVLYGKSEGRRGK